MGRLPNEVSGEKLVDFFTNCLVPLSAERPSRLDAFGHPLVVIEVVDHYLGVDPRHVSVCLREDVFELVEEGCKLESDLG